MDDGLDPSRAQATERIKEVLRGLPDDLKPPDPSSPAGRILAAARALLAARGLERLSVRQIAAEAGVNQAMIHYYYGSKEKLIQAVVRAEILSIMGDVIGGLEAGLAGRDLFAQFPLRMLAALRRDAARAQLLRRVLASAPERLVLGIRQLGRHGIQGASRVMLALIVEAQQAGRLPEMEPRSVFLFLVSNVYGLVLVEPIAGELLGVDLDDERNWKRHLENLHALILGGLRGDAGKEV